MGVPLSPFYIQCRPTKAGPGVASGTKQALGNAHPEPQLHRRSTRQYFISQYSFLPPTGVKRVLLYRSRAKRRTVLLKCKRTLAAAGNTGPRAKRYPLQNNKFCPYSTTIPCAAHSSCACTVTEKIYDAPLLASKLRESC